LDIQINLVVVDSSVQPFLGNKDFYENALPPVTAGRIVGRLCLSGRINYWLRPSWVESGYFFCCYKREIGDRSSYDGRSSYDVVFRGTGEVNPYQLRRDLTDIMDAKAYVFRDEEGLQEGLRKVKALKGSSWKHVDDKAKEYNTNFINVMEIDSMLRIAEIVLKGALRRQESRGHTHGLIILGEMT
jgi:hypothetical protein